MALFTTVAAAGAGSQIAYNMTVRHGTNTSSSQKKSSEWTITQSIEWSALTLAACLKEVGTRCNDGTDPSYSNARHFSYILPSGEVTFEKAVSYAITRDNKNIRSYILTRQIDITLSCAFVDGVSDSSMQMNAFSPVGGPIAAFPANVVISTSSATATGMFYLVRPLYLPDSTGSQTGLVGLKTVTITLTAPSLIVALPTSAAAKYGMFHVQFYPQA